MPGKKKAEPPENHERWMVSYADFLTLLFAVFVVLYSFAMAKQSEAQSLIKGLVTSFSEVGFISSVPGIISLPGPVASELTDQSLASPDSSTEEVSTPVQGGGGVMDFGINPNNVSQVQESEDTDNSDENEEYVVQGNLTVSEVTNPSQGHAERDTNTEKLPEPLSGQGGENEGPRDDAIGRSAEGSSLSTTPGEGINGHPFDAIRQSLSQSISSHGAEGQITMTEDNRWLTIHISSSLLFAEGSSSVLNASKPVIAQIAQALKRINNYVRIRGYTDNSTVANGIFRNNWDLSANRAISVLDELVSHGIEPNRLAVEGYGQYSPFFSNSSPQGRQQNRRVVIAISRYALSPPQLQVVTDDTKGLLPAGDAKPVGASDMNLKRNEDGSLNFDF